MSLFLVWTVNLNHTHLLEVQDLLRICLPNASQSISELFSWMWLVLWPPEKTVCFTWLDVSFLMADLDRQESQSISWPGSAPEGRMQALRLLPLQDRRMPQWRLGTARAGSSERKRAMHGGVEEGDNISLSLSLVASRSYLFSRLLCHMKRRYLIGRRT